MRNISRISPYFIYFFLFFSGDMGLQGPKGESGVSCCLRFCGSLPQGLAYVYSLYECLLLLKLDRETDASMAQNIQIFLWLSSLFLAKAILEVTVGERSILTLNLGTSSTWLTVFPEMKLYLAYNRVLGRISCSVNNSVYYINTKDAIWHCWEGRTSKHTKNINSFLHGVED